MEPIVVPGHAEGTDEIGDCGEFKILDRYVIDFTMRLFFNQDGTLKQMQEQVSGSDTFINSATGKEIRSTFHNAVLIDPKLKLGANSGVIFRVTVPGSGAVMLDVGRIVTNKTGTVVTFEAGPHQFFEGDLEGLCAALS